MRANLVALTGVIQLYTFGITITLINTMVAMGKEKVR